MKYTELKTFFGDTVWVPKLVYWLLNPYGYIYDNSMLYFPTFAALSKNKLDYFAKLGQKFLFLLTPKTLAEYMHLAEVALFKIVNHESVPAPTKRTSC